MGLTSGESQHLVAAGSTHTDWGTVDGKHAYEETGERLNFFEYKLRSAILSPLPSEAELDPKKGRLDRRIVTMEGSKIPCIMLIPNMSRGYPGANGAAWHISHLLLRSATPRFTIQQFIWNANYGIRQSCEGTEPLPAQRDCVSGRDSKNPLSHDRQDFGAGSRRGGLDAFSGSTPPKAGQGSSLRGYFHRHAHQQGGSRLSRGCETCANIRQGNPAGSHREGWQNSRSASRFGPIAFAGRVLLFGLSPAGCTSRISSTMSRSRLRLQSTLFFR